MPKQDTGRCLRLVLKVLKLVIPFLILVGYIRPDTCKGAASIGYGLFCVSSDLLDGLRISETFVSVRATLSCRY